MNNKLFAASICFTWAIVACTPVGQSTGQIFAGSSSIIQANSQPLAESTLAAFLMNRFGLDERQAMGGLGAVFALAQQRMVPEDFMQLSASVPNMDRYLSAVPQSQSHIQWGAAADAIGGRTLGFGGLSSLGDSFQALGMNPEMAFQFVPAVLQFLQQRSELVAMSLLQNALY